MLRSLGPAAHSGCPYRRLEWFIDGTQPTQYDTIYHSVVLDSATGRLRMTALRPSAAWISWL